MANGEWRKGEKQITLNCRQTPRPLPIQRKRLGNEAFFASGSGQALAGRCCHFLLLLFLSPLFLERFLDLLSPCVLGIYRFLLHPDRTLRSLAQGSTISRVATIEI